MLKDLGGSGAGFNVVTDRKQTLEKSLGSLVKTDRQIRV